MTDTLTLLTMTHADAFNVMLQESLKPGVSANALEPGFVTFGSGTNATASIHLKEATYNDPAWPYRGQVSFQYHRLYLDDFFQGIDLEFKRAGLFQMSTVVTALNHIFQIQIEPGDFVDTTIDMRNGEDQTVTLLAYPNSRRWKGSVQIHLIYDEYDTDGLYGNQNGSVYENDDNNPYTPGG